MWLLLIANFCVVFVCQRKWRNTVNFMGHFFTFPVHLSLNSKPGPFDSERCWIASITEFCRIAPSNNDAKTSITRPVKEIIEECKTSIKKCLKVDILQNTCLYNLRFWYGSGNENGMLSHLVICGNLHPMTCTEIVTLQPLQEEALCPVSSQVFYLE